MLKKIAFSLFLIVFINIWISCGSEQYQSRELQSSFTSFEAASKWYQNAESLEWMFPESTSILKAAFHKNDGVLLVFFKRKPLTGYIYGGVPLSIWKDFQSASSKGSFYKSKIQGKYRFRLKDD